MTLLLANNFLTQPWPWYVAGPVISLTMFLLLYFGKEFGISRNLATMCAIGGASRYSDFFRINWRDEVWNLTFLFGTLVGGFIAAHFLHGPEGNLAHISDATVQDLQALGITVQQGEVPMVPDFYAHPGGMGWLLLVIGGFLVGFGTRYAGGCTSGHAISGLSNLQLPSLVAVIGFFIGGLLMTFVFFPLIFG